MRRFLNLSLKEREFKKMFIKIKLKRVKSVISMSSFKSPPTGNSL